MRRAAVVLGALLALLPGSVRGDQKPVVMVFGVTLKGVGGAAWPASLTAHLTARLRAADRYEVVTRARAGQAALALSTQIHRMGAICIVASNLVELRTSTTEAAATARGGCSEPALRGLLDGVVAKLTGTAAAPAAPPPAPPPSPTRGLTVTALTVAARARHGIPAAVNFGVVVAKVGRGTPAGVTGLQAGDVILEVGGKKVDAVGKLLRALFQAPAHTRLLVHRRGKTLFLRWRR